MVLAEGRLTATRLLFITYLFVLIPNRRVSLPFEIVSPFYLLALPPSLSRSPAYAHTHAPIPSRLYIYDELKWKRLHFGRLPHKYYIYMYCIVWKTLAGKINERTSKPTNQRTSCWLLCVEWHCEKPQKSCAHHNVLTVF